MSTFMCLWAIYLFLGSVHIFSCSRIGTEADRSWEYINGSQRHMNVEIGTEAAQFLSGNICFEFSALCLCSVRPGLFISAWSAGAGRAWNKCKKRQPCFSAVTGTGSTPQKNDWYTLEHRQSYFSIPLIGRAHIVARALLVILLIW